MLRIYIAGPYSDSDVLGVLRNIGRGQAISAELFEMGYAVFCPWHDKEFVIHNWKRPQDVQKFLDYSMEWLKVSDALFVVPNIPGMKTWQESTGTLAEIEMAKKLRIPICHTYEDLYWLEKKMQNKPKDKV